MNMNNEHEYILLHDYKIITIEEDAVDVYDDEIDEDCNIEEEDIDIDDIYSENHTWDSFQKSYRNLPEIWMIPLMENFKNS